MKLQLFRNGVVLATKEAAVQGLRTQLETNGLDGEVMVARYIETIGEETTVKTIFGFKAVFADGTSGVTIYDGDKDAFDKLSTDIKDGLQKEIDKAIMSVDKVVEDEENNKLTDTWIFTHGDKSADLVELKYDSSMPDDLATPNAVGGIKQGKKASELKEMTYGQIIDMILFPELQPTVGNPSASISFKAPFTNNQILEIGATAPKTTDFNTSLNRGTCTVAGQPNKNRAGALDSANSFVYYGGNVATTTLPTTVQSGTMTYNYHAAYGVGDTLVTSYGNKASVTPNPLAAGSVNSGAIQIFGTYPYFCNGQYARTDTKDADLPSNVTPDNKLLPLQKLTDTLVGAKFASEAATNVRNLFEFPATKKVTKVEFMNPVSNSWDLIATSAYETLSAQVDKTIQGQTVKYKQLTTVGALSGERQMRFTLANA